MAVGKAPPPAPTALPRAEATPSAPAANASSTPDAVSPKVAWQPGARVSIVKSLLDVTRTAIPTVNQFDKTALDPTAANITTAVKLATVSGAVAGAAAANVGNAMGHSGEGLARAGTATGSAFGVLVTLASLPDTLKTLRLLATSTTELAETSNLVWKAQSEGDPAAVAAARARSTAAAQTLLAEAPSAALSATFLVGNAAMAGNVVATSRATYAALSQALPSMAKSDVLKKALQVGLLNSRAEALVRQVAGSEAGRLVGAVARGPWGKVASVAFKVVGPVYAVMDAVNVHAAWAESPRDMKKVALRSLALAGTTVMAAVAFVPAAVISATTATAIGTAASAVWGAAKLGEYFYEKAKMTPPLALNAHAGEVAVA